MKKPHANVFKRQVQCRKFSSNGILDGIAKMLNQLQVGNADQANQILEDIKQRFQSCADKATELLKLIEAEQKALLDLQASGFSDMEARHQRGEQKAQKKEKDAKTLDVGGSVAIGFGVASGIVTAAALIPSPIQPACVVLKLATAMPTAVVATGALLGGSLSEVQAVEQQVKKIKGMCDNAKRKTSADPAQVKQT